MNKVIRANLIFFIIIFPIIINAKPKLSDFAHVVYSQWGEDGIISKIFEHIGTTSKISIEFGAANGFHCSNTANLFVNHGWKSVLIESNVRLFDELKNNVKNYDCIPIWATVGFDTSNSLEAILEKNGICDDIIDLLSIDIDGDDYYIFKNLQIRPRVILCEYNPTFPSEYDLYPTEINKGFIGCSVAALERVAGEKGYKLIAVTLANAIFVREEEFDKFSEYETSLGKIKIDLILKYVITDYEGNYMVLAHPSAAKGEGFGLKYPSILNRNLCGEYAELNWTVKE